MHDASGYIFNFIRIHPIDDPRRDHTVPDKPKQTQTGPSKAKQNQTAQEADGPDDPDKARQGQTAKARPDRVWLSSGQNQPHVPSCDNISVNKNSNEFQSSSKINQKCSPHVAETVNRNAVVGPSTQIRTASKRKRRFFLRHADENAIHVRGCMPG